MTERYYAFILEMVDRKRRSLILTISAGAREDLNAVLTIVDSPQLATTRIVYPPAHVDYELPADSGKLIERLMRR